MGKKIKFLLVAVILAVTSSLMLLHVSANQGGQNNLPDPTPTPGPNWAELQPMQPLPTYQTLSAQASTAVEVVERRTATSKHYRLGSNLYRAEISVLPIHYQDAQGNWQNIDLNPVTQPGGGFKVEASNVKITFPQQLQSGLDINATIYSAQDKPKEQLAGRVKPNLAALSQKGSTVGVAQQTPAIELSWHWQPQNLAFATESGSFPPFLDFNQMMARIGTEGVEYFHSLNDITVTFQPTVVGFTQRLHFSTPPPGANIAPNKDAAKLEYRVYVKTASNIQLYSQGVRQTGSFTTDLLEVRNQAGQILLIIPAPQLRDQTTSRFPTQTQYRVESLSDGLALIAELPLDWLMNPNRKYPVTAESSIVVQSIATTSFNAFQDTFIWQCNPASNFGSNTVMYVGNFGCSGAGAERALAQWAIDSLPANAMMSSGQTTSQLWRLPISDTGTSAVTVNTHRLFKAWNSSEATWLTRTATQLWTQAGAENDYLVGPESTVTIPFGGIAGYVSMGSLDSLVGAWHTDQYFGPWGDPNNGVIYKSNNESTANLDRAFATFNTAGNAQAPLLSVTYFDDPLNDFPAVAPNSNFFLSRAPSPDYFSINNVSGWRAFGIRPLDSRSDYDLFLSSTPSFTFPNVVTASLAIGSAPDFIVINPNVSSTQYPWVAQWEGTGLYYFRYGTEIGTLDLNGITLFNSTAFTFTVLSVYRVNLTAGTDYEIKLNLTSGDADLGMALFPPTAAGGSNFMTRGAAVALADASSFGGKESIVYRPNVSGQYGLVVWNNGNTQSSNYQVSLGEKGLAVYLPAILKNHVPPLPDFANGGFETGTFSPWFTGGPGGSMVASLVSNPSPSCFSGNFTARLGTPGKLANDTIPVGEVWLEQQFKVPANATQLTFKYQVNTYDIIQGAETGRFFDRFEAKINGSPVHVDGNPAGSTNGNTLYTSGCKTKSVNLSAFAGKNISLRFSVYNLVYPSYNTWAFVDNVQVQ
jgi:hypothetical protein